MNDLWVVFDLLTFYALQCSISPDIYSINREAWPAGIHGVAKSRT